MGVFEGRELHILPTCVVTGLGVLGGLIVAELATAHDDGTPLDGWSSLSVWIQLIAMVLVAGGAVTAAGVALDHLTRRHPAYRVAAIAPISLLYALAFRSDSTIANLAGSAALVLGLYWAIFLLELAAVASWRWVRTRR